MLFFFVRMHRYTIMRSCGRGVCISMHSPLGLAGGARFSPLHCMLALRALPFLSATPRGRTCPPTFKTRSPRSLIRSGSHPRAAAIPSGRLHHVPALWGRLAWPLTRHSHLCTHFVSASVDRDPGALEKCHRRPRSVQLAAAPVYASCAGPGSCFPARLQQGRAGSSLTPPPSTCGSL